MRLVIDQISVKNLPKEHQLGSVQMPFTPGKLDSVYRPIRDIFLHGGLVPFQVESADFGENNGRISIPRPSFELPGLFQR